MTRGRALPVAAVGVALLVLWYGAALLLNGPQATEQLARAGVTWTPWRLAGEAFGLTRPILPTPDKILLDLVRTTFGYPPTDPRSLVYHASVTAGSALAGFVLGSAVGAVLAVGIVHVRTLESSLMPWVIGSQTVPILAIAPMVVVILGNLGLTGVLPKAAISAYLSFFPVTIGMTKGLRSPDPLALDLMRTYSAGPLAVLLKLRLPGSVPYLFAALKVGVAVSMVGAIVAELPTGGTAGLGARLLSGSYYGQTLQIWSALVAAAALSLLLVYAVGGVERLVLDRMGRPR